MSPAVCSACGGTKEEPKLIKSGELSYYCLDWFHAQELLFDVHVSDTFGKSFLAGGDQTDDPNLYLGNP